MAAVSKTNLTLEQASKLDPGEVCSILSVDHLQGLNTNKATERLKYYGYNILPTKQEKSFYEMVKEQLEDRLVQILIASAVISTIIILIESEERRIVDFVEPLVILLILIANGCVSIWQEIRAEVSLEALKEYQTEYTWVKRKDLVLIKSSELVPGDIVHLKTGNKVPADLRILQISSSYLAVDQAILTGESKSCFKTIDKISELADKENNDKRRKDNVLFSGTYISFGKCLAVVVQTGCETEFGKIGISLIESNDEKSPLKIMLDEFSAFLSKIIFAICIIVWLVNINRFRDPSINRSWIQGAVYYFKIAVSLAVAAIPEGLPAVITTCLALGTQKMAKKNAIVRKLDSVQSLGCLNVLCTDKTGTLTSGNMCVASIAFISHDASSIKYDPKLEEIKVSGFDYSPNGDLKIRNKNISSLSKPKNEYIFNYLNLISKICTLCNDATLYYDDQKAVFKISGDPTEGCLLTLVEKISKAIGFSSAFSDLRSDITSNSITHKIFEFTRRRKMMSYLVEFPQKSKLKEYHLFCKGAPEVILKKCSHYQDHDYTYNLNETIIKKIDKKIIEFSSSDSGLRCLALAIKTFSHDDFSQESLEKDLTFLAIVGLRDPPKESAKLAILKCNSANVDVKVLTGDSKTTAQSICHQVGLFSKSYAIENNICNENCLKTKETLDSTNAVNKKLFYRVEPLHKLWIIEALQNKNKIVAMTGDGVNDAPALKKADIGIAMGSGTALAQSVSDIVILDNDLSTITDAIEQGRSIHDNIKHFIRYLISSNIGEVISIFLIALFGLPDFLIPVQLLWVNLVTDGLPATALGFNDPDPQIMNTSPKKKNDPLITRTTFIRFLLIGTYVGFATILATLFFISHSRIGPKIPLHLLTNHNHCSAVLQSEKNLYPDTLTACNYIKDSHKPYSIALTTIVLLEMLNSLNSLSETSSLFSVYPWSNKLLLLAILSSMLLHLSILNIGIFAKIFQLERLSFSEWVLCLKFALPVIVIDEIFKYIMRNFFKTNKKSDVARPKTYLDILSVASLACIIYCLF